MNKDKVLYHYCPTSSFLSIMESRSVWLSDIGKSNDAKELYVLRHYFYEYVFKQYKNTHDSNEKNATDYC